MVQFFEDFIEEKGFINFFVPVTPPDVLHDKERGKGAKKANKTGR
jgi:hypothetical protein